LLTRLIGFLASTCDEDTAQKYLQRVLFTKGEREREQEIETKKYTGIQYEDKATPRWAKKTERKRKMCN